MKLSGIILILLLPLFLAACFGSSTQVTEGVVGDENDDPTSVAEIGTVTPAETSEPTITFTPESTSTEMDIPEPIVSPTIVDPPRLCSPLAGHTLVELEEIVSAPYDPPQIGRDERHQGIDLAYYRRGEQVSILGVKVQAMFAGRVVSVIDNRIPYGNMVIIETSSEELPPEVRSAIDFAPGESIYHLYAHLGNRPLVDLGDLVICGQNLGEVGMTGYNIVSPHLHLETRLGPSGKTFPEMSFYNTRATPEEMENYRTWRMSGVFHHFDPLTLIRAYLGE